MSKHKRVREHGHTKRNLLLFGLLMWTILFVAAYLQISSSISSVQGRISSTDQSLDELGRQRRSQVLGTSTVEQPKSADASSPAAANGTAAAGQNTNSAPAMQPAAKRQAASSIIAKPVQAPAAAPTAQSAPAADDEQAPPPTAEPASQPEPAPAPGPRHVLCVAGIFCL